MTSCIKLTILVLCHNRLYGLVLRVYSELNLTKVILVIYPNSFSLEEAKGLVQSLSINCQIVKVVTQKYSNHSEYGLGSGKAE